MLGEHREWSPPVVATVATEGRGLDELVDAIAAHRRHLASSGELVERRELRVRDELRAIVLEWVAKQADVICSGPRFDSVAARVADGVIDPYTAATELVAAQSSTRGLTWESSGWASSEPGSWARESRRSAPAPEPT